MLPLPALPLRLRRFQPADAAATRAIFRAAVAGACGHYCAAERAAWAAGARRSDWDEMLGGQITWLAEVAGQPAGFMTLGRDGHLDLAYVAPAAARRGVGTALHDRILAEAHGLGLAALGTGASLAAVAFFERMGWRRLGSSTVRREGLALRQVRMAKTLRPA